MAEMSIDTVLSRILEQENSDEMAALKRLVLKRMATETNVKQARVPAPINITEASGYYNLLKNDETMRRQLLATVLGLPYIPEE